MVKGISKRIVVVKPMDTKIFEEAIFIVREDVLLSGGVSSEELVEEAQRVAHSFARTQLTGREKLLAHIPGPVFAVLGAAATGIAWFAMRIAGVPV